MKKVIESIVPTPECDKLKAVAPYSQRIGEFVDWLESRNIHLCEAHQHTEACYDDESGHRTCGYCNGDYWPVSTSTVNLLAEFFEIDLNKVEAEKQAMLDQWRETQGL